MQHGIEVRVHRTTEDKRGNRTVSFSHTLSGCGLAPRAGGSGKDSSTENTDRAATVNSGSILYVPFGSDILPHDVVELPDETRWEVDGKAAEWRNPLTGWGAGVEVQITRKEG